MALTILNMFSDDVMALVQINNNILIFVKQIELDD